MLFVTRTWRNWARTARSTPVMTVAPRTLEHVQLAVERARETGHTVKVIGASHSFSAIGATDGVRLDLSRLRGLVDVDLERGRVTLWAGTYLWELPDMLGPLGLALPNMGDIDRQTISGAISTGTHGTGLAFGSLSTMLTGATLVTGTGEIMTVSEDEHAELLPALALGLGALGVLVTVTLQCVPRFSLHAAEAPSTLGEVLNEFEARTRSADHFEFFWFPHAEGVRTKTNTRLPADAPTQPLSAVARFIDTEVVNNVALNALVGLGRWAPICTPCVNRMLGIVSSRRDYSDASHRVFVTARRVKFREMEYSVPLAAVPQVMRELRRMIERRGFTISFPIEVRATGSDALWLSPAVERESGYIAVHRYFRDPDREYFHEAEAIFADYEGRPHWGKMHTRDAEQLRALYPRFDDFVALRNQLDPDRVFANDYLRRVLGE